VSSRSVKTSGKIAHDSKISYYKSQTRGGCASLRLLENVKKQVDIIICLLFIITFYLRSNYGLAS
jgi:hypothetical protein